MVARSLTDFAEGTPFRIYYEGGARVDGTTRDDWNNASRNGVQVVVWMEPWDRFAKNWPQPLTYDQIRQTGFVYNTSWLDRMVFTGVDRYNAPFNGWQFKNGSQIEDAAYFALFDQAVTE